jgi:hypothetical protein
MVNEIGLNFSHSSWSENREASRKIDVAEYLAAALSMWSRQMPAILLRI